MHDGTFIQAVGKYTICEAAARDQFGNLTDKLKAIEVRHYSRDGRAEVIKTYNFTVGKEGAREKAVEKGVAYAEKYKDYPVHYKRKLNKQP